MLTSQKIYPYLTENDTKLISQYTESYFDFINVKYGSLLIESFKSPKVLKPTKVFPEYLLHDKRELLAEKLKIEFKTETGIGIRLMIEALQANEPKLLSIENRQRKAIHSALKAFFDRDIKSYQAVFDYKFDIKTENKDFNAIKIKLDFIINQINNTK